MHDAKGRPLNLGSYVMIPARITSLAGGTEYCNVSVDLLATMPPTTSKTSMSALNTKQILRAEPGDDLSCDIEILADGQARLV